MNNLDINILMANIDRFEQVAFGVLIVELSASPDLLHQFIERCKSNQLTVEILGYVCDDVL